jgi:sugar porter (SP) family MFS transporter
MPEIHRGAWFIVSLISILGLQGLVNFIKKLFKGRLSFERGDALPDTKLHSKPRVNSGFIWKVSLIAGLGGILYGYDMGIIAAALIFVRGAFSLSTQMEEMVVSVVLVGAMLGAIVGGTIADRIGRRATLLWGGGIFIVGSILAPLSPNVFALIAARGLLGIAIGFTSVTAPVYVSELSPPQSRGTLIGLYQFALTVGIALADLVGYWLAGQQAWRLMFGLGALPALLFLIMVMTLPESPRWLVSKQRFSDAESVLSTYTDDLGTNLLMNDIRIGLSAKIETRWSALWNPAVRGALLIAVGFTVLQQVTGINTIIYYGPQIFSLAGITSNKNAIFATLIVAVTNVFATVIALVLVDRVGRKPLLYAGVGGMTVSLFVLSFAFHSQASLGASLGMLATLCLMVYITCFAFSMGPIAWILVSEVFPLRVRGRGVAAATLGSGISNFLVSITFLSLIHRAGNSMTFAIYGIFCIATLLFVRFVVPETKGRALESISSQSVALAE